MSIELDSVNKIKSLIESASAITGESYEDLTSAIQGLKNGYGKGGDDKMKAYFSGTSFAITEEEFAGVTTIPEHTLAYSKGLTSLSIPDTVTSIGESSFYHCTNVQYLKIPISLRFNNQYTFQNMSGIKHVDFSLGDGTRVDFSSSERDYMPWLISSSNLESATLPNGMTRICSFMFYECTKLKSVNIPDGVKSIGQYAFYHCNSLESIDIPNGVANIEKYAFARSMYSAYPGLTKLAIPSTITSIGEWAFGGNTGLTDIYYGGTEEEWAAIEIGEHNEPLSTATIHYNSTGLPE